MLWTCQFFPFLLGCIQFLYLRVFCLFVFHFCHEIGLFSIHESEKLLKVLGFFWPSVRYWLIDEKCQLLCSLFSCLFFWTLFGLDEPLLNKILDPIFPCQPNLILRFQSFHAKMHTNTELFMLKNAEKSLEWNIVLEKNGRFMITRIPM